MQGIKRKVVYVILFELVAIILTTYGLTLITGRNMEESGVVACITSFLAIVWNLGYNTGFEYLEARLGSGGRSLACRVVHAVGFEIGLAMMVVPVLAYVLRLSLWAALLTNIGIMLFFMAYAFVFTLAFDKVFGLPLSAGKGNGGAMA